jgi:ABC-type glycerol-3-phosphate transport system substrate-binding protein
MTMPHKLLAILGMLVAACAGDAPAPPPAVRLVHTFNPVETAALDELLAGRDGPVATALLPFARGQGVLHEVLRSGQDCPDVARIDATWLPGLVDAELLAPAPPALVAGPRRLAEAAALADYRGATWALAQSLDGLAVVYRPEAVAEADVAWPPRTLGELEAAARRLTRPARWGLGLRVDGYWLVAWLRDGGADVADGTTGALGVDDDRAVAAVDRYAALLRPGGVSPPPPPPGEEAASEARRFRAGELAALVTGPWALPELTGPGLTGVAVAALPGAPRGGQLLVVPRCAGDPDGGWRLAAELTAPRLTAAWSHKTGMIPATVDGLAGGSEVSRQFHAALADARPLPRHPMSAWLFDDLTPAVAAVVSDDATADEAVAGLRRSWSRLLRSPP